jgi:hypothetical protein
MLRAVPLFVIGCLLVCGGAYLVDGVARFMPEAAQRREPLATGVGALGALVHAVGLVAAIVGGLQLLGGGG